MHHRGGGCGCVLPLLLLFGVFFVFGKFLGPLLILLLIAAPFVFFMSRSRWGGQYGGWRGGWNGGGWNGGNGPQQDWFGDKPKRGDFIPGERGPDEKPKRDGDWV
jgi:hypothetical protein